VEAKQLAGGTRREATPAQIVALLKEHRALGGAPIEELEWVAARGFMRSFEAGEVLASSGSEVEGLLIIFSGHLAIYVDRGEGRQKFLEWHGGDVAGMLPYSRLKTMPGYAVAVEPSELLTVPKEHLPELIRRCPEITAVLVHVMLDRARAFQSSDLHSEKMKSLGKLAAGLAHELNNPASALVRSAKSLAGSLAAAEEASRGLGAAQLTPAQRAAVDAVRNVCLASKVPGTHSTLEAADRVDAISDWLSARGVDAGLAVSLADTPVTLPALDGLAEALQGEALAAALRWVGYGCATRSLARDIETAASRVYELVAAVKGFTYMDRETVARPMDLRTGLADTVTVLRAKARAKSAEVSVTVQPDLPPVQAYGGELNQVWVNLIDNALDAIGPGGRVEVNARQEGRDIVVQVSDDGPGIPEAARPHIFEPFFTTKPQGRGMGLGLGIVHSLVSRHSGGIEVDSRPGHTVFSVRLPLEAKL
jgi:signal transduction histidine kinase